MSPRLPCLQATEHDVCGKERSLKKREMIDIVNRRQLEVSEDENIEM